MPYERMEEEPWMAWLLRLIARMPTPSGYGTSPWEKLQDIVETAQEKETTTHPRLNPLMQLHFPEYIAPQQFSFEELASRMGPQAMDLWKGIMAGRPQEVWGFPFQTRPGEIFRPELPARVRAPQVTEKGRLEQIKRARELRDIGVEEERRPEIESGKREIEGLWQKLTGKKLPYETIKDIFGTLPEEAFFPQFKKAEKPPKWLTGETKTLFKGKEERETEIRAYQKKFQSAWAKVLEKRDFLPEDKRKFWNSWRINVPKDLRHSLGLKLGLIAKETTRVTPAGMPEKSQRETYNECRDAGGTHEECLRQTGVKINR